MNIKGKPRMKYRSMNILALIAGGLGIVLQLIPDGEILAFMLSAGALGGLTGGSPAYSEQERLQLQRSFKTAYEALLLVIMFAYAIVGSSRWFHIAGGVAAFLNGHWPGLVISVMCLLMGLAGLQRVHSESPA